MKLKYIIFLIAFLSLNQSLFAQTATGSRYYLNKDYNDNGQFYLVKKKEKIDTIGFFKQGDSIVYLQKKVKVDTLYPYKINGTLKGLIERNKDTLKFESWYTKENNDLIDNTESKVDINDTAKYIFVINQWELTNKRYPKLDVHFRQRLWGATNIPFRIKTDGNSEASFLNANVTYLWIRGTTRFYKSKYVYPRTIALGHGPYLGFSAADNDNAEKPSKNFRPNVGWNAIGAIGDLSIIVAVGIETNFSAHAKFLTPYIGFGLGFKLVPIGVPSKPK
jgi:hypothetical protein